MALSNIFREPRREITEQLVGIAALAMFLYFDWHFAVWLKTVSGGEQNGCPLVLGLACGAFAIALLIILWHLVHAFGESVCDFLKNRGLELRPKTRYR